MLPVKNLLTKLQNYCAYQERSQYEVRQKLFDEKVYGEKAEQIISSLIEENFLNEERFAIAYAGGKFRIKRWGKIRIKMGLRQKQVPEKLIIKALKTIDPADYREAVKEVIEKKSHSITEKNQLKRKQLLLNYAIRRGFEPEIVSEIMADGDA